MAGISNPFHFLCVRQPTTWKAESSGCFCESLFLRHHRDCLSKILQLNHFWHFLAWVFHIWVNRLLTRTFKETYFFQRVHWISQLLVLFVLGNFVSLESHFLWRYGRKRIILVNFTSVLELFRRLLYWMDWTNCEVASMSGKSDWMSEALRNAASAMGGVQTMQNQLKCCLKLTNWGKWKSQRCSE